MFGVKSSCAGPDSSEPLIGWGLGYDPGHRKASSSGVPSVGILSSSRRAVALSRSLLCTLSRYSAACCGLAQSTSRERATSSIVSAQTTSG